MIAIPDMVLNDLCEKMSIRKDALTFLGGGREDSDGTVYSYSENEKKKVLKVLAFEKDEIRSLDRLKVRAEFAYFLGSQGIPIACPKKTKNNTLCEVSEGDTRLFAAYRMDFFEGHNPECSELSDELVRNWGKMTGKQHRVSKDFYVPVLESEFGYEQEVKFFTNWCRNTEIKEAWKAIGEQLSSLPRTESEYGFIHNDNHQRNILVDGEDITLIDFDCSSRQFFVQDIITPAQGMMFDVTGGMYAPVSNQDKLDRFFDCFLNGYEQEYHLTDFWHEKLPLFLNYRRMLLFTCLQDFINTQPEMKRSFIQMIQSEIEKY